MKADEDICVASDMIRRFPCRWDGRRCVMEMKERAFNWRQVEWWAFYWELLFRKHNVLSHFKIPGDRINRVRLDMKAAINWDLKAKAENSDSTDAILNDVAAVEEAIRIDGAYGVIVGLCIVEYNDENRSFQAWRERLQGGPSSYTVERRSRTDNSRLRKTKAELREARFLIITDRDLPRLGRMQQGRNSNGRPRPPKYVVDLADCGRIERERVVLYP